MNLGDRELQPEIICFLSKFHPFHPFVTGTDVPALLVKDSLCINFTAGSVFEGENYKLGPSLPKL